MSRPGILAAAMLFAMISVPALAQSCGGAGGSCSMSDAPKEALFPDEEAKKKEQAGKQMAMCPCCQRMMKGGMMKGMMGGMMGQKPGEEPKSTPAPGGDGCH